MLQALQPVVGCLQRLVGHHQHVDALLQLDLGNFSTLFIQQEGGNIHWDLAQHRGGVVFQRLFLNDAQNLQR